MSVRGADWLQVAVGGAAIAGVAVQIAKYFTVPRIRGEIEAVRPGSDPLTDFKGRIWILTYVVLYNSRPAPTSLKALTLTVKLEDGEQRTLQQDLSLTENYWDQYNPEGQPARRAFLRANRLEQRDKHEGWIGFPCGIDELGAVEYVVTATDVRGKAYRLKPYKEPVSA